MNPLTSLKMSKREREEHSLGDALKQFISSHKLENGLNKVSAEEAWHQVMGPAISRYTQQIILERDTLLVRLSSSVLREELSYGKDKIIKNLNEHLQQDLIKKIILQ